MRAPLNQAFTGASITGIYDICAPGRISLKNGLTFSDAACYYFDEPVR